MASIDRTAYPRFKRTISVRELREAYSPSLDALEWARQMTDSEEALLSLTMCLKCCQRMPAIPRKRKAIGAENGVAQILGRSQRTLRRGSSSRTPPIRTRGKNCVRPPPRSASTDGTSRALHGDPPVCYTRTGRSNP